MPTSQNKKLKFLMCRSGRDWLKEHVLTGGDPAKGGKSAEDIVVPDNEP